MNLKQYVYVVGVLLLILTSCTSKKVLIKNETTGKSQINEDSLNFDFCENCFSGWLIKDVLTGEVLYAFNEKKYFIPASTVKILVLYSVIKEGIRQLPAIEYFENDSILVFSGLGDPTFLHPDFQDQPVLNFLKSRKEKKLMLNCAGFDHPRYGTGWMWDDYAYEFQPEISPLPLFGNTVFFQYANNKWKADPPYFNNFISTSPNPVFDRLWDKNLFKLPENADSIENKNIKIPFIQDCRLTAALLSDTLGFQVDTNDGIINNFSPSKILSGSMVDTVIRRVMYQSDNLFAEQTLLSISGKSSDSLSIKNIINNLTNMYLNPDEFPIKWMDASGLSRYNLISPQTLVNIWTDLYNSTLEETLFPLISPKGKNVTSDVKSLSENITVIAKSGSMTGVYNLSGFIITPSGRRLVFTIMNNHFKQSVSAVRKKVTEFLNNLNFK